MNCETHIVCPEFGHMLCSNGAANLDTFDFGRISLLVFIFVSLVILFVQVLLHACELFGLILYSS